MSGIPVLVIGGDRSWRRRLQDMLCARADLQWLGAYAPAQARPQRLEHPVLLLLDGDDLAVERGRRKPGLPAPRRIYFFRRPGGEELRRCIDHGASGCLDKLAPSTEVLRALRAVEAGLFAVEPTLLRRVLAGASHLDGDHEALGAAMDGDAFDGLTPRQRDVAHLAMQGLSNKEIARELDVSPETVKTHLHNIYARIGLHHRMQLQVAGFGRG